MDGALGALRFGWHQLDDHVLPDRLRYGIGCRGTRWLFDTGRFAKKPGDEGCLYLLGCKGPMTYADCPDRLWNAGTNWCVGAGAPCTGCAEARSFDRFGPVYEKVTDERLERLREAE